MGGAVHRLGSCAEQQDSGQDPQLDVLEGFAHSPPTVRVALQQQKITAIAKAEYAFSLVTEDSAGLYGAVQSLLSQPEILIEKKTKKGIKTVDIKPDTEVLTCTDTGHSVDITMYLPAGTQTNYNPTLFIEALRRTTEIPFEPENIRRTAILCADNTVFE